MENHIGRNVLCPGNFHTLRTQRLKKTAIGFRQDRRCRVAGRLLPCGTGSGWDPQHQCRFFAQESPSILGDGKAAMSGQIHFNHA